MDIQWECRAFHELTTNELYKILQVRNEVFIIEQNCPYQDCDNKDQHAFHLWAQEGDNIYAYTRLLPPNISYEGASSIGRVLTSQNGRGKKLGKELMERSIVKCHEIFGNYPIRISAQSYLKKFYESLGFIIVSAEYLEDNIPHFEMLCEKPWEM